jgi:hypothetical protein
MYLKYSGSFNEILGFVKYGKYVDKLNIVMFYIYEIFM